MTTIVSGDEVMATAPDSVTNKVHVPPAAGGEYSSPEAPNDVRPASAQSTVSPDLQDWDYGQRGGGDLNMEARILGEDLLKARGLDARDELDHFLPAALDATDYEESLKDAMEYEDVQPVRESEIPRQGIGFVYEDVQPAREIEISRPRIGFVKSVQRQADGLREVQQE